MYMIMVVASPLSFAVPAGRGGAIADLREHNLALILRHLRNHGPSSRAEIAAACGLGVSTLTELVVELRTRELVDEAYPLPQVGAGRPVKPIVLTGDRWVAAGIRLDIDGISARTATVGGKALGGFSRSVEFRGARPRTATDQLLAAVRDVLAGVTDGRQLVAIEVAVPGTVEAGGSVGSWAPGLDWREIAVGDRLRGFLADAGHERVQVGVDNDINLAGLAALRVELPESPDSCVYFGGERSVGGAVLSRGDVYSGAHGGAGELGHLCIEPGGRKCWCGRIGCLETRAGLVALLVDGGLLRPAAAERQAATDARRASARLLAAAVAGNEQVLATLAGAGQLLGAAVDATLVMFNPQTIALGGYLGRLSDYLRDGVEQAIAVSRGQAAYRSTQLVSLGPVESRVLDGAVIAARDACLNRPTRLTTKVSA